MTCANQKLFRKNLWGGQLDPLLGIRRVKLISTKIVTAINFDNVQLNKVTENSIIHPHLQPGHKINIRILYRSYLVGEEVWFASKQLMCWIEVLSG